MSKSCRHFRLGLPLAVTRHPVSCKVNVHFSGCMRQTWSAQFYCSLAVLLPIPAIVIVCKKLLYIILDVWRFRQSVLSFTLQRAVYNSVLFKYDNILGTHLQSRVRVSVPCNVIDQNRICVYICRSVYSWLQNNIKVRYVISLWHKLISNPSLASIEKYQMMTG